MQPLLYFFPILIVTSFIGFGISLFLCRIDLLKRIVLSPIIGYSAITITVAQCSYIGLGTNQSALPIFSALIFISIVGLIIKRENIKNIDDSHLNLKLLIPIILFGLANAAILLAPTVIKNSPHLFGDHSTYIAFSEYFRSFGFFSPINSGITPWKTSIAFNQNIHLHVGAQFFTSFFSALFQSAHTIAIYPSILGVVAFMFMSSVGLLYLNFREEKSNITEILFILFFSVIAINLGSENLANGFLPQALGVSLFVAIFSLTYAVFYINKKYLTLIGFLFAASILTYHETTLFYGTGIFIFLLFAYFFKKNPDKKLFIKFILTHTAVLILLPIATREFILAMLSLPEQNLVGWHVSFTFLQYIQTMFGQDYYNLLRESDIARWIMIPGIFAAFFCIYLLLRNKFREDKKNLFYFILLIFSPFIVAIFTFAYIKFDPFTNEIGHTWRIFKAVGYSYWIIPILAGMAVYSYYRETKSKQKITIIIIFLLIPSVGAGLYHNYINQKNTIEIYANNNKDPLDELKRLANNVEKNRQHYSPANLIDLQNSLYSYLILSILKNTSTGDIPGLALLPATDNHFYTWIHYQTERANTAKPITKTAGFLIYPPKTSSVYLFDGFSGKEGENNRHYAWLASNSGTIKALVPQGEKAQFSTMISNWQEKAARVEIMYNGKSIFLSDIGSTSIKFESPVLSEGNHQFTVNYYGTPRAQDANEGRTLYLIFGDTTIKAIK